MYIFILIFIIFIIFFILYYYRTDIIKRYQPSHIVIIRHGNKPSDPLDPTLSETGKLRSTEIVNWIKNDLTKLIGKDIHTIFAPLCTVASIRPLMTSLPSAFNFQIPLFSSYFDEETELMADRIYTDPLLHNKAILIVWEHTCIQQLTTDLGIDIEKIPFWNSNDFGTVYIINKNILSFSCENLSLPGEIPDSVICDEEKVYKTQLCGIDR